MYLKYLIVTCSFFVLIGAQSSNGTPPGSVEGHLKIISLKEVELAEGNAPKKSTAGNYSEYPLIILDKTGQKEVAHVMADRDGNYSLSLPPGDYILDVQGRSRGLARAKPRPFTIVSDQTVRVDMDIDTGVR